ncbi:MAG: nucleotidyltransferase [bacterium]|nr:nucleotidyltransferase [bacterium]
MIVLIPLAGEGKRYKDEGYKIPKSLILIDDKPMILMASDFLPRADKWIYIVRKEHVDNYRLDEILKAYSKKVTLVIADKLTEGQASTCMLAKNLINTEEELLIGACDNGMLYDLEKFNKLKENCDCIVWTFRNNVTVVKKPQAYGWVVVDENNNVLKTSVKIPISNNPIRDHAIIGTFWFKHSKDFVASAERMIKQNRRINNEFYVDECINDAIALGLKVKVFEVDKYICWGTPNDLRTYEYWSSFFKKYDNNLNKI